MTEGQNTSDGNIARSKIGFSIPKTIEQPRGHAPGFNPMPYGIGAGAFPSPTNVIPRTTLISGDRGGVTERQRERSKPLITHGLSNTSKVGKR